MPTVKSQKVAENDATILLAVNDLKKRKFKSVHATAGHHNVSMLQEIAKGTWKEEGTEVAVQRAGDASEDEG